MQSIFTLAELVYSRRLCSLLQGVFAVVGIGTVAERVRCCRASQALVLLTAYPSSCTSCTYGVHSQNNAVWIPCECCSTAEISALIGIQAEIPWDPRCIVGGMDAAASVFAVVKRVRINTVAGRALLVKHSIEYITALSKYSIDYCLGKEKLIRGENVYKSAPC